MTSPVHTPGVYVREISAFPMAVVPVPTAVPVFIGYTPRAELQGRSLVNQPCLIGSWAEYLQQYGATVDPVAEGVPMPAAERVQYAPAYRIIASPAGGTGDVVIGGVPYDLEPDPASIYYLHPSLKLFFENGGSSCYVISVGPYGSKSDVPKARDSALCNPNVRLSELQAGLDVLRNQSEPTLVLAPDALLLSPTEYGIFVKAVLAHCGTVRSRMGLFDIQGGQAPPADRWMSEQITPFRDAVGTENLGFGAAYFPFLKARLIGLDSIDFQNFGGLDILANLLPEAGVDPLKTLLNRADEQSSLPVISPEQIEIQLRSASKTYRELETALLEKLNTLPACGALAGVYAMTDAERGVWVAPANVGLNGVDDVTLRLTDSSQAALNVEPATGKSINGIRFFTGRGVLVWGARTLDGNSTDWRYINVRRTLIFIEQSIRSTLANCVFEPNDANTWAQVQASIEHFLRQIWSDGGLVGATPAQAFGVAVGLGSTMTAQDVLDGLMNVQVRVAMMHPAEFIVLTVQQVMQTT